MLISSKIDPVYLMAREIKRQVVEAGYPVTCNIESDMHNNVFVTDPNGKRIFRVVDFPNARIEKID